MSVSKSVMQQIDYDQQFDWNVLALFTTQWDLLQTGIRRGSCIVKTNNIYTT